MMIKRKFHNDVEKKRKFRKKSKSGTDGIGAFHHEDQGRCPAGT